MVAVAAWLWCVSAGCASPSQPALDCCDAGGEVDPDLEAGNQQEFTRLLNMGVFVNYQAVGTFNELVELSDLVVVGRMMDLIPSGTALGFKTSLAAVSVDDVLTGVVESPVYVELMHSPAAETGNLLDVLPRALGVWLLQVHRKAPKTSQDRDRGKGLPDGASLWAPVSPQGFVLEHPNGYLTMPLEPDRGAWFSDLEGRSSVEEIL